MKGRKLRKTVRMHGKLSHGRSFKHHGGEIERRTCNHRIKWENAVEQPRESTEPRCKRITLAWFIPSPSC